MHRSSWFAGAAALMAVCVVIFVVTSARPMPALAQSAAPQAVTATPAPTTDSGVTQIHGAIRVTNRFELSSTDESIVALLDLTAFIKRDRNLTLPYADQTSAGIYTDPGRGTLDARAGGRYTIPLPIEPRGTINNVAHGQGGAGVMAFSVDFFTNEIGDPFFGPFEFTGWSNGNDGLAFDQGTGEVNQGEFLVWSPDDNELFPTGFGPDGKLFTDDDPVGPLKHGWTVIKVFADKKKPFQQIRTAHTEVPILEGLYANNDLSNLSYTAAFDELVKQLRIRYVFTDFKHMDWDKIVKDIRPLVQKADKDESSDEFSTAIVKFTAEFHDGHVGTDALTSRYFSQQGAGGLGLVLGELDDGTVIAREVVPKLPAAKAGIKAGAAIIQWNGQPIAKAIAKTPLLFVTESSPIPTLLQQLVWIERSRENTTVNIQFQNPGDKTPQTVKLASVKENVSLQDAPLVKDPNLLDMPLTYKLLQQGDKYYGYIQVTTFEADDVYLTRAWENALNAFKRFGAPVGLIVDMRENGGGNGNLATYFAGSFYTSPFEQFDILQADTSGNFISQGKQMILPAPVQWTNPVAVLVGPDCASACEIFSGAVAHDPNHLIVGYYPSAGIEAGVEAWTLPEDVYFQAPVERLVDPTTQQPYLEGVGVQPNVKVPVTAANLLSKDDAQIAAAEQALDKQMAVSGN